MQAVAVGGLVFQVIHVLEHGLQFLFWALAPTDAPWLSSWAAGTADGLQYFCSLVPLTDGKESIGAEMLHFTGNTIFLGALTAWHLAMRAEGRNIVNLGRAEKVQLFHVAEHVLLVGSVIAFNKALGLSTLFGLIDGALLSSVRVCFHFGINAIATTFALMAARDTWLQPRRERADEKELGEVLIRIDAIEQAMRQHADTQR